jgi:hypothetical protein
MTARQEAKRKLPAPAVTIILFINHPLNGGIETPRINDNAGRQ